MSLLIENVRTASETSCDILIEEDRIEQIGSVADEQREHADQVIDGSEKLAAPSFLNGHTHAAMTLLRGWGDDLPLDTWLNEKIWPAEAKLVEKDVYWGTRLACLEMIKSGTTFFNDMYWHFHAICRAVEDSGLRARVSGVFIDHHDLDKAREQIDQNLQYADQIDEYSDRLTFSLGPHAFYTVSEDSLQWAGEYSRDHDLPLHIHAAETKRDVEECREEHGMSPIQYLDRQGVLHERTVIAHGIWVDEEDIKCMAERGVRVIHNPVANAKLVSGMHFPYETYREASVPIGLGTDGVASNNNHDLFEEVKLTALLQKSLQEDPEAVPAEEALSLATRNASSIFQLDAGRLEEGARADLMLLDLNHPSLQPLHNVPSQLAYAASGGAVDTTICDGRVLMENRSVEEEDRIRRKAAEHAHDLVQR